MMTTGSKERERNEGVSIMMGDVHCWRNSDTVERSQSGRVEGDDDDRWRAFTRNNNVREGV